MTAKKLYIKTYGCQMNVYDTIRMQDVLKPLGYAPVESPEGADMVILNTCHIREKAEEKVYSDLGRVRKEKEKRGGKMLVAVGGCVAQAEGDEVIRRAPYVDMVFGPQSYHQLPELVTRALRQEGQVVSLDLATEEKFDLLDTVPVDQGVAAFISVQEGCDKFCTFCVVPYTRGAEISRKVEPILDEVKKLVDAGTMDIMLLGQNVNAYHGEAADGSTWSLARLIEELAKINGIERIRYMTSHPRDMQQDLIDIHAAEKVMPYIHLPVQSGSDAILKKMNRKHTAEFYLDILMRLRKVRPDIAFSSDFIVGFPGETDSYFNETMSVIQQVGYASAYSFKYSPRPGTPAAVDENQVPEEVKTERLARLQELVFKQQTAFNQSTVGKVMPVVFDRSGKREGQSLGRSPYLQSVYVDTDAVKDQLVNVKITKAYQNSVSGEVV